MLSGWIKQLHKKNVAALAVAGFGCPLDASHTGHEPIGDRVSKKQKDRASAKDLPRSLWLSHCRHKNRVEEQVRKAM